LVLPGLRAAPCGLSRGYQAFKVGHTGPNAAARAIIASLEKHASAATRAHGLAASRFCWSRFQRRSVLGAADEPTRAALDDRCGNARVTISTLTREKIRREGKKTLASIVQRA
jgi:hypothetical protein